MGPRSIAFDLVKSATGVDGLPHTNRWGATRQMAFDPRGGKKLSFSKKYRDSRSVWWLQEGSYLVVVAPIAIQVFSYSNKQAKILWMVEFDKPEEGEEIMQCLNHFDTYQDLTAAFGQD